MHYYIAIDEDDVLWKEPELAVFLNEVATKIPATKWELLGVQLRLDMSVIGDIKAQLAYEPTDSRNDAAFIGIFTNWKKSRPSAFAWGTLISVLQTRSLGEQTLAQELYEKLVNGEIQ